MPDSERQCELCGVFFEDAVAVCPACGGQVAGASAPAGGASAGPVQGAAGTFSVAATTPQQPTGMAATTPQQPAKGIAFEATSDPSALDTVDGTIIGHADLGLVGTMVGEYQVTSLIGQGGMGTVYAGLHPLIGKHVAIKVLNPALSQDPEAMRRFLDEAKAVNRIRHPNIIDIFSFGELRDGSQYFIMEHLVGQSLSHLLGAQRTVSYADGRQILAQVLDALVAAHKQGIVHRDLKPDNIYLADHPRGGYIVKLLDFGIAKFTADGAAVGRTRTGVPIGTPLYMSPEQCRGVDAGPRSDLYSVGVIMYEMFTGRPPFQARSIYQLVNAHVSQPPTAPSSLVQFPSELERLILWCLAKDQAVRPASAGALKAALLPVLDQLGGQGGEAPTPMPALPEPPLGGESPGEASSAAESAKVRPGLLGHRRGPALGVGALVLGVGALVVLALRWPGSSEQPARRAEGPSVSGMEAVPRSRPDGGPARAARTAAGTVVLQFAVNPSTAPYRIWVNGRLLSRPEIEVPQSRDTRLEILVSAAGYRDFTARPLPLSHLVLPVNLEKVEARPAAARRRAHRTIGGRRPSPEATSSAPTPRPRPRRRDRVQTFGDL